MPQMQPMAAMTSAALPPPPPSQEASPIGTANFKIAKVRMSCGCSSFGDRALVKGG